jgi:phosphoribosylanthranilate isomerase
MSPFFRIKICGVTQAADADRTVRAGADAIGLNFYPHSPRCVDLLEAAAIVRILPPAVAAVGVFVNEPIERVIQVADQLGLQYLQLHGDESPEYVARLAPRRVIRAFRLRESASPLLGYVSECQRNQIGLAAVLVDSYQSGDLGGTGRLGNWGLAAIIAKQVGELPLILAGGLSPENVASAIEQVWPAAVDVASGVECEPGRKDDERMRQFVSAARAAWESRR